VFIFCVWEKGWSKGQPFFMPVYYLCTLPAQFPGVSLPGQPGNVLPAATAAPSGKKKLLNNVCYIENYFVILIHQINK